MTTKLNVYQLVFALLLVLKIGNVPGYEFSWFVIISPLIIGTIHGFIWRLLEATKLPEKAQNEILGIYLNNLKKRTIRKSLKEFENEQKARYTSK